jgi:hypothetical protein
MGEGAVFSRTGVGDVVEGTRARASLCVPAGLVHAAIPKHRQTTKRLVAVMLRWVHSGPHVLCDMRRPLRQV